MFWFEDKPVYKPKKYPLKANEVVDLIIMKQNKIPW
jgi:hypothetical protein